MKKKGLTKRQKKILIDAVMEHIADKKLQEIIRQHHIDGPYIPRPIIFNN